MKRLLSFLTVSLPFFLMQAAYAAVTGPAASAARPGAEYVDSMSMSHIGGIDWAHILQNPNIFILLLSGAVYGLLIEFAHPGVVVPGLVGSVCLFLTMFALQGMTIDYTGLALMVTGMGLMAAEAFLPAFGALAIGGAVAFVTGAVMLQHAGLGISLWLIGAVTVVNFGVLTFFLRLAVKAQRMKPVTGKEALISSTAEVLEWEQGKGRVRAMGDDWKARAADSFIIKAGDKVKVTAIEGLTLVVEPEQQQS